MPRPARSRTSGSAPRAAVAANQAAIAERDILATALETAETTLKSRTHGELDEMLDLLRKRRRSSPRTIGSPG